jgi:transcriptional regulator with GAF, ATPase, and Fis domain
MVNTRYFISFRDLDGREKVYHLATPLMVGRAEECHVCIDMEGISRQHCTFSLVESKVVLKDLKSTNGTFLNGTRISEAILRPGDRVVVGPCTLRLVAGGSELTKEAAHTRLLGQTTIDTLLEAKEEGLPDPATLRDAGLSSDYLDALFKLTEIVNSVTEMDELHRKALSVLLDLFGMDLGCIFRSEPYEANQVPVLLVNNSGLPEYHPSTSVLKKVLEENISVIASDIVEDRGLFKSESIAGPGTACIMCVPMRSAGLVRGAIYLSSLARHESLKAEALQLLAAMVTQIGLAYENLDHLARLKRDNLALRSALAPASDLAGSSRAMKKIRKMIEKVAATGATVLITGESGTGKELIANAIHARSNRRERPLVSINCGAIPETMVESELFGHERGAFTGAIERKLGKFELASEGTLFLDEIGELPPGMQVKLLRALEQRNFYRVGGESLVHVDVRIIAATNSDLAAKVDRGEFRSDLLYRLKVFVIQAPPLREHPEDIPELSRLLLDQIAVERRYRISEEGMKRIMEYAWPGNIRELRNVLEREVILTEDDVLHMAGMEPNLSVERGLVSPRASLKEAERVHILRVLRSAGWNKKAAAEILGIGRPTIYDKMKQYGIREGE